MAINSVGGEGVPPPVRGPGAVTRIQPASGGTKVAPGSQAPAGDEVSLTSQSQRLRDVEAALAQEPAFDGERVDALRKAIANGEYRVDGQRLAGKLLDFESDLLRP